MINNTTKVDGTKPTTDFRELLAPKKEEREGDFVLGDGSRIAVIGGGPAGSFFSYFALKMADMIGRDIKITIFEPKDFLGRGPGSCNHCGGIVSELMVQTLALEGINIPSSVIQKGVNSYLLHTEKGDVRIETPKSEKTIASVYRGGGPKGINIDDKESFDNFLLKQAVKAGAEHRTENIDMVAFEGDRPALYSGGKCIMDADLVVGAFGVNSRTSPVFDADKYRSVTPRVLKTAIAEISMDPDYIRDRFGTSVHLFLLPIKNVKFAAIIPKRSYVTLCILGKGMDRKKVEGFLRHPNVSCLFPEDELNRLACLCLPMMSLKAPSKPYADRFVVIGDLGSTRLYKDGIGAAYFMGKSAAKTVVMHGVGKKDFQKYFMPDYRSLITDNRYGRFLFTVTDMFRDFRLLTSAMLNIVRQEQTDESDRNKVLSTILWDMFTGNERYRNVFPRAVGPEMMTKLVKTVTTLIFKGSSK